MGGHPKDALNAFWIANTNLDMGFGVEPCVIVYRSAFEEDATNSINVRITHLVLNVMQHSDNGAIKVAH